MKRRDCMNPKNIGMFGAIQTYLVTGCILLSQVFLRKEICDYINIDYIRDSKPFLFFLLKFLFVVRDSGMFLYILPITWTLLSLYIISGEGLVFRFLSFPLFSGITIIFALSAIAVNIALVYFIIF